MESICELLGTLLLPGKKPQTMKTEMAKAVSLHLIPAEFQREVLIAVFLDTPSSGFESSHYWIFQFNVTITVQGQLDL